MSNELKAIIEGILFVCGDEGVTLAQLADVLSINEESLQSMMDDFVMEYNQSEERGMEAVYYGRHYKLVSKALCHPYVQKLFEQDTTVQFSQAALETLAIIAYNQPITRVEIEEIRGVSCEMMLKKLQARNLIREAGRLDTPGLPYTYEVTDQFMDTFSLKSLDELPKLPEYQKVSEEGELFD